MKKAVQFGGGNIGRGFTGQLFSESGYEVVFVDVVKDLVDLINKRKSYPIRMACDDPWTVTIDNVRAVNGLDVAAVADEITNTDLICTAVGVNVLPRIAPTIAAGVKARADAGVKKPVNIIICENLQNMAAFLKKEVKNALDISYHTYVDEYIGFVESVVGRMVPVMTEEQKQEDPLLVIVEPYKHLPISKSGIKGVWENIEGIEPEDNFQAYVDRKLYAHNAGHATAAYLGYVKGYGLIWEAMADAEVEAVTRGAMRETGEALIRKHGLDANAHWDHVEDLLSRFANKALGDQVARVGGDPYRKLGPSDRLVGGAKLALEQGVEPENLCKAIAAALVFDPPADNGAAKVQEIIEAHGVVKALEMISGLEPGSSIVVSVAGEYESVHSLHRVGECR